MRLQRIAFPAVLVAGLAALPFSAATAQYYYPPCNPFPLFWPFCAAAAVVGTAGAIVTAPFRPPYYYGPRGAPYYPPPPGYYAPAPYYYGPR
jgi:hypothetical protein